MKKYMLDQEGIELERVQWADIYQDIFFRKKSQKFIFVFKNCLFLARWPLFASIASSVLYVVPLGNCAFAKIKPTAVGM